MKVKGGELLGCGGYGCVCTLDNLKTFDCKNFVLSDDHYKSLQPNSYIWRLHYRSNRDNNTYELLIENIDTFITKYKGEIVFKHVENDSIQMKEYNNFQIVSVNEIPHSVLFTEYNTDDFHDVKTFYCIECELVSNLSKRFIYTIMKKMEGTVYNKILPFNSIKQLESTVSKFLGKLHERGYFHFDIKPENILYKQDTKREYEFVVSDYGFISYSLEKGVKKGTSGYLSPMLFDNVQTYQNANTNVISMISIELIDNKNDITDLFKSLGISTDYFGYMQSRKDPNREYYNYLHADYFALGITILELLSYLNLNRYSLTDLLKKAHANRDTNLLNYIKYIFSNYIIYF